MSEKLQEATIKMLQEDNNYIYTRKDIINKKEVLDTYSYSITKTSIVIDTDDEDSERIMLNTKNYNDYDINKTGKIYLIIRGIYIDRKTGELDIKNVDYDMYAFGFKDLKNKNIDIDEKIEKEVKNHLDINDFVNFLLEQALKDGFLKKRKDGTYEDVNDPPSDLKNFSNEEIKSLFGKHVFNSAGSNLIVYGFFTDPDGVERVCLKENRDNNFRVVTLDGFKKAYSI